MNAEEIEAVLGTVHALFIAEDKIEAASLVCSYPARIEQTGFDNWNGGTEIWTIYLDLPPAEFSRLGARRPHLEELISAQIKAVLENESSAWYSAKIVPARTTSKDWRTQGSTLPKIVRQNIIDGLRLEGTRWQGALEDIEMLGRIYDLEKLPSHDPRYRHAADDIWQHTVNNDDWESDWVFTDSRFGLTSGSAESFLRFLCELVHPVVRPDRDEAVRLVSQFNDQLHPTGWEIFEEDRIGGRPRYAFRRLTQPSSLAVKRARTVADALNAGWMAKEIQRLEHAIDGDPDLAIGTAKELVETCCKTILGKLGVEFGRSADISDLTKLVVRALKLVPENITDEIRGSENIKHILRNLTAIPNHLAQLRGLYGTGHGRDGSHKGLQPRHARLAVAAAVAFVDFIAETYRDRGESVAAVQGMSLQDR